MNNPQKGLNDVAWEKLFDKYCILDKIESDGRFEISAAQIKEFREPRLMAKFDHAVNLPKIFAAHKLAILPISRGDYVISNFSAYHRFEPPPSAICRMSVPAHLQSLDANNIPSESIALNCAFATGIIADFLQDENIVPTVSGRMGSGSFGFSIGVANRGQPRCVQVNNSQIEIDAAYEGVQGLSLFEAKRDISDDFLVRQLYYPYRLWRGRVAKPVRTLFLVHSNGIYRLREYLFQNPNDYNSLVLVGQKNYSIEDTAISRAALRSALAQARIKDEPRIPFPQADSFERVINICEILCEQELSRSDVTEQYAFDARQTNYYTDAARYLGLLEKKLEGQTPVYMLSEQGRRILGLNYKQRQLAFCSCIFSHRVFRDAMKVYFETGRAATADEIIRIMKGAGLRNMSGSTYKRRASTVGGWLKWALGLVKNDAAK